MTEYLSKVDVVRHLSSALAEAEESIRSHPEATVHTYEQGLAALQQGMQQAQETEWSVKAGLSLEDLAVIHRYMLAMSFISAWWHLRGDKQRRDKAAHTASLLIAGVGIDSEDVMRRFLTFEHTWRTAMRSEGIVPESGRLVGVIIGALLLIIAWLTLT